MSKNCFHIIVSCLLVVSLFTPTIISVISDDDTRTAIINLIEEEPGKDEKKEVKELDVFIEDTPLANFLTDKRKLSHSFYYVANSSNFLQKIVLPPPEMLS